MTLQSSGAISLANVQTEFGGSNPIGINEYYGVAAGVPASGTISLNDFYGKAANNWNWATYYQMGNRDTSGGQTISDSYSGNIVTPGAANSPVTFLISTGPGGPGGTVYLYLYIGGSWASTYSGSNSNVSSVTSFGSSSLQFRSDLYTAASPGYTVFAEVKVGATITYSHVTNYVSAPGSDD